MTLNPSQLPKRRIHLAEDDDSMRGFLVRALDKAGYAVIAFAKVLEAYERLKEEPFTLLLTDIVMPRIDGPRLAVMARERRDDLLVLFTTGYARDASPIGDTDVLHKPYSVSELARKVRTTLDRPA